MFWDLSVWLPGSSGLLLVGFWLFFPQLWRKKDKWWLSEGSFVYIDIYPCNPLYALMFHVLYTAVGVPVCLLNHRAEAVYYLDVGRKSGFFFEAVMDCCSKMTVVGAPKCRASMCLSLEKLWGKMASVCNTSDSQCDAFHMEKDYGTKILEADCWLRLLLLLLSQLTCHLTNDFYWTAITFSSLQLIQLWNSCPLFFGCKFKCARAWPA